MRIGLFGCFAHNPLRVIAGTTEWHLIIYPPVFIDQHAILRQAGSMHHMPRTVACCSASQHAPTGDEYELLVLAWQPAEEMRRSPRWQCRRTRRISASAVIFPDQPPQMRAHIEIVRWAPSLKSSRIGQRICNAGSEVRVWSRVTCCEKTPSTARPVFAYSPVFRGAWRAWVTFPV